MSNEPTVLNASEAADVLGAHVETVRRLARRGELPSFKVGKDWRFRREDLFRWIEQQSLERLKKECSVLVIDDDDLVRASLARILARLDCNVRQATDGVAGLNLVDEDPPDLILLDLKMPRMHGPEFLEHLREDHPLLPVVIITGYPDGELMIQATEYAPVMLLSKPVDAELLERTVRAVLGAKLAQGANP